MIKGKQKAASTAAPPRRFERVDREPIKWPGFLWKVLNCRLDELMGLAKNSKRIFIWYGKRMSESD